MKLERVIKQSEIFSNSVSLQEMRLGGKWHDVLYPGTRNGRRSPSFSVESVLGSCNSENALEMEVSSSRSQCPAGCHGAEWWHELLACRGWHEDEELPLCLSLWWYKALLILMQWYQSKVWEPLAYTVSFPFPNQHSMNKHLCSHSYEHC